YLLDVSVSQSSTLLLLHSIARFPTVLRVPSYSSVTLSQETAPVKLPTIQYPYTGYRVYVRIPKLSRRNFKDGSIATSVATSKPPTYPAQKDSKSTVKL